MVDGDQLNKTVSSIEHTAQEGGSKSLEASQVNKASNMDMLEDRD